jgi:hypothetical protein
VSSFYPIIISVWFFGWIAASLSASAWSQAILGLAVILKFINLSSEILTYYVCMKGLVGNDDHTTQRHASKLNHCHITHTHTLLLHQIIDINNINTK